MYYLNCFFIYSIIGFLLETGYAPYNKSGFNSGILYGPWTPIYGIGTVLILVLSHYFFMNLHMPRWIETIIVFFIVGIFLSCIELIGGILIEKNFSLIFWDYSKHKYHIGTYISLEMTAIWGLLTVIFIYVINPLLSKLIEKIPWYISIFAVVMMLADFVITFINKIRR